MSAESEPPVPRQLSPSPAPARSWMNSTNKSQSLRVGNPQMDQWTESTPPRSGSRLRLSRGLEFQEWTTHPGRQASQSLRQEFSGVIREMNEEFARLSVPPSRRRCRTSSLFTLRASRRINISESDYPSVRPRPSVRRWHGSSCPAAAPVMYADGRSDARSDMRDSGSRSSLRCNF